MRLAFIPPFSLLKTTFRTDYQLMLPQLVGNEDYAATYQYHCQNKDTFVILDNGAAEGVDFDWETMINIAYQFDVNEMVIPDTLGDKDATIDKAQRFKDFFEHTHPQARHQSLGDFQFMFVIQGKNFDEVMDCAFWGAGQDWITTLGIPRHLLTSLEDVDLSNGGRPLFNVRTKIANDLTRMGSDKEIHFLGGNPVHTNEVASLGNSGTTNQAYVRGMDTSMPFNYAFRRLTLGNIEVGRPEDYFNQPEHSFDADTLEKNLSKFEFAAHQNKRYGS